MNKQEFLDALRRELAALPADELDEAIRYYDEYISDAGDGDIVEMMGSPRKVAEDFKREYYDRKPPVGGELTVHGANAEAPEAKQKGNTALYIILGILIIGFGAPILRGVVHRLPHVLSILILFALVAVVIKVLSDRNKVKRSASDNAVTGVETCSDIMSISMNLNAGKYVLRKGASFGVDGVVKSYIRGGVWYIDEERADEIVTVTVPDTFTARELNVSIGSGDLLIRDITAYSSRWETGAGSIEADNVFTQQADIRCGAGRVKADLGVNGDVNVKCGAGSMELDLKNRQSDFNLHANVGPGRVTIGNDTISGAGRLDSVSGAFHSINADCGIGEIKITFAQ